MENYNLTGREKQILRFVTKGHQNREIAAELNISILTVETHLKNIYKKMKVNNRYDASELVNNTLIIGQADNWFPPSVPR